MSQDSRYENLHLSELPDKRNNIEVAFDTLLAGVIDVIIRLDVQ